MLFNNMVYLPVKSARKPSIERLRKKIENLKSFIIGMPDEINNNIDSKDKII